MKNNVLMPNLKEQECTGCSMCAAICPTKAIEINLNKEGFYVPTINEEMCTSCGLCKKVCYKFDENVEVDKRNDYASYSAINKDETELKTATSGGVSIELMRICIEEGFKVVGVAYDYDKEIAVTKVVSAIDELEQFKGSKYFQSYTKDAFEEILNDKSNQKYAVFGTPCQIYGLSKYADMKKNRDKFVFVDLFCHGCPSMNLWKKYLDYAKRKFKVEGFDKIEFRSKTHGWHEYCNTFYDKSMNEYNSSKVMDPFYTIFFEKKVLNEACYNCKLRSTLVYTDIRLGDFWGHKYDENVEGVSAVVISSEKGRKVFKHIENNIRFKKHEFNEVIKAQSYGRTHELNKEVRKNAIEMLSSGKSMEVIINEYKKGYSFIKKVKMFSKSLVKMMPLIVSSKLRKIVHIIKR